MRDGISVVIPCLNESETIRAAIQNASTGAKKLGFPYEVIVVDNGSRDHSAEIALIAGARIVNETQKGYGSALNAGIRAANFSWVIFADADLSYPFEDLDRLVKPLEANQADFVLGSRIGGTIDRGAMPFLNRYLGTPVLSWLIFALHGLRTSDCNSGMRALRADQYESLKLKSSGMEYASEMLIQVARLRLRYQEVSIHYRKDGRSGPTHLRRFQDGFRHLRRILFYSFI